ncbi:MAG: 6-phosphofructokinase [Acidobacteriia bacterium]|nr:6-phosphofructokinase [Terriglobia bacterium]
MRTIGISTGGGDCPGLNAVIRAVVKAAILAQGWRVLGIEDSFDGLIWPHKVRELKLEDASGLLERGGTILGTTNRGNPFHYQVEEDGKKQERDFSDQVVSNAQALGLDGLVVLGGDGTMAIALALYRKGLKLVGVPKTIDNDLAGTEITVGFDTALHTAMEAIDKIHSSAESHHRVMLVEVMGREAGWIALEAGMTSGADVILIPEIPFNIAKVCETVRQRDQAGKRFTIVAVAEGISLPAELQAEAAAASPDSSQAKPATSVLREAIARRTGKETRLTVLGHIQRGGPPSPFDRVLGTRFGVAAVDLLARNEFGKMVCVNQGLIGSVELSAVTGKIRRVDPQGELVRAARAVGVCFGD